EAPVARVAHVDGYRRAVVGRQRYRVGVHREPGARWRREQVGPPGGAVAGRRPRVYHADRQDAVVAGPQQVRPVRGTQHHRPVEDEERLLVGVHVRRYRATGFEGADPEPGVHRGSVLVQHRPPREADARTGREVRVRRPLDDVPSAHGFFRRAASATRYPLDSSTSRRARSTSASSRPLRLRTTPSTTTVSTLDTSAHRATAATGSMTGATLSWRASMRITSARLPGVSDPVRCSTPATCAPLTVAISSSCRAVRLPSAGSLRCHQIALLRARSAPKAARIWVNMSPGTVVTTSIDRLGRSPDSSAFTTGGQPCPICVSTWAAMDTVPPVSATSRHSSSLR